MAGTQGTPRKLRLAIEKARPKAEDEIALTTIHLGSTVVLGVWPANDAMNDEGWPAFVIERCQDHANEQQRTTLFEVKLTRGEKQLTSYSIRCKGEGAEENERHFDGSAESLVKGLYEQNEKLLNHTLSQGKAATEPLVKTIDALHARCNALEKQREELVDENHKLRMRTVELEAKLAETTPEREAIIEQRMMKLATMFGPQVMKFLAAMNEQQG